MAIKVWEMRARQKVERESIAGKSEGGVGWGAKANIWSSSLRNMEKGSILT
jgi:hypothetical protein